MGASTEPRLAASFLRLAAAALVHRIALAPARPRSTVVSGTVLLDLPSGTVGLGWWGPGHWWLAGTMEPRRSTGPELPDWLDAGVLGDFFGRLPTTCSWTIDDGLTWQGSCTSPLDGPGVASVAGADDRLDSWFTAILATDAARSAARSLADALVRPGAIRPLQTRLQQQVRMEPRIRRGITQQIEQTADMWAALQPAWFGMKPLRLARTGLDAVVFDMDGTLTDTEVVWDQVRREMAEQDGVPWPPGATTDMMGMSTQEWSSYLADVVGLPGTAQESARRTIDAMVEHYRLGATLLPDAVESVLRMADLAPIAIASSSPPELIAAGVDTMGLHDVVQAQVSTQQVGAGKPAPDGFLHACALLGADPEHSLAVEDSTNGLLSALNAKMITVAVPNSEHPPAPDVLARADAVLGSLRELDAALVAALLARK